MMKYRLYCLSDKTVSFREFGNALDRISEFTALLRSYCTKDEAVERMAAEMGFPREECSAAYDFYTQLFAEKKLPEVLS